tara:strand:- start:7085 stop:7606 length:522 start_codon:yes stop_codon:yes gene_type:complete
MINQIIQKLQDFAEYDFPVPNVTSYLSSLKLNESILKKYHLTEDSTYTRNLIHKETDFEIMIICWPPMASAPIHGHEGEKCWARVQTGKLKICNYEQVSADPLRLNKIQEFNCEPGFLDGPADIHSVENLSDEFASSLHVYAKPYDACDIYDIEKGKVERKQLKFHSINGIIC